MKIFLAVLALCALVSMTKVEVKGVGYRHVVLIAIYLSFALITLASVGGILVLYRGWP